MEKIEIVGPEPRLLSILTRILKMQEQMIEMHKTISDAIMHPMAIYKVKED